MDDLISRQAAIDVICTEGTRLERNGTVAMCEIKQWCVDLLDALPSAQPERKVGEWEPVKGKDGYTDFRCSACHRYRFHNGEMRKKYKFCPNCGAKVVEE